MEWFLQSMYLVFNKTQRAWMKRVVVYLLVCSIPSMLFQHLLRASLIREEPDKPRLCESVASSWYWKRF